MVSNVRVDKALIPVHKAVPQTLHWQALSFTESSIAVDAQHWVWRHQGILQQGMQEQLDSHADAADWFVDLFTSSEHGPVSTRNCIFPKACAKKMPSSGLKRTDISSDCCKVQPACEWNQLWLNNTGHCLVVLTYTYDTCAELWCEHPVARLVCAAVLGPPSLLPIA